MYNFISLKYLRFTAFVLFLGVVVAMGLRAEPYVTVSPRTYTSGVTSAEWAGYVLETAGTVTVQSGATVSFGAGSSITLYPGFSVEAGASFNATVSTDPTYNPGGYYNGITPTLALIAGDQQYGQVGQFNLLPFDIAIWNQAGTAPLVNAPVLLTVVYGGGWLSDTNGSGAVLTKTLSLMTDVDGTVHAYFQQSATELVTSSIQVIAGSQRWEFTTFSYSTTGANADTDGDGISDTTETLLGMNTTQPTQTSSSLGLLVLTP